MPTSDEVKEEFLAKVREWITSPQVPGKLILTRTFAINAAGQTLERIEMSQETVMGQISGPINMIVPVPR